MVKAATRGFLADFPARCCARCAHGEDPRAQTAETEAVRPFQIDCRWGPAPVVALPRQVLRDGTVKVGQTTLQNLQAASYCCSHFTPATP